MDGEARDIEGGSEDLDVGSVEMINVRWTGTRPLLLHNERLADPLDPIAIKIAELTSRGAKEKKTEAHIEQVARLEWEGGLYLDDEGRPCVPGFNLVACIRSAAKLSKLGAAVRRAVQCMQVDVLIDYEGPRDLDGMWAAGFVDRRGVKIGQRKVQRVRPKFTAWALTFQLAFVPEQIGRADLVRVMRESGSMIGLGDFRERFGRFDVSIVS